MEYEHETIILHYVHFCTPWYIKIFHHHFSIVYQEEKNFEFYASVLACVCKRERDAIFIGSPIEYLLYKFSVGQITFI